MTLNRVVVDFDCISAGNLSGLVKGFRTRFFYAISLGEDVTKMNVDDGALWNDSSFFLFHFLVFVSVCVCVLESVRDPVDNGTKPSLRPLHLLFLHLVLPFLLLLLLLLLFLFFFFWFFFFWLYLLRLRAFVRATVEGAPAGQAQCVCACVCVWAERGQV